MSDTVALTGPQAFAAAAITNAAEDLRHSLNEVKDAAEQALATMDAGFSVSGNYGPLGTQLPMDVAAAAIKLNAAVQHALAIGCASDVVDTAYRCRR